MVSIRGITEVMIIPLVKDAACPPVEIRASLKVWLSGEVSSLLDGWDPGIIEATVELVACGTVTPVLPHRANVRHVEGLVARHGAPAALTRQSALSERGPFRFVQGVLRKGRKSL